MIFLKNVMVTDMDVFEVNYRKTKEVEVPGRELHALTWRMSGAITIGDMRSEAGCLTYTPRGVGYRTEILESGSMIAVHFSLAAEEPEEEPLVLRPGNGAVFRNLFSALYDRYQTAGRDYAAVSVFYEILSEARREAERETRHGIDRRMLAARSAMEQGFSDPDFSIEALAETLDMSPAWLRQRFRESFGEAPMSCLRRLRLSRAKTLLRSGYYTVGETAARCGYGNQSYFTAEFRRYTGVTPGNYAADFASVPALPEKENTQQ